MKVIFENPNMIGYSIYDPDFLHISVNLTSICTDGSSDLLYGRYEKPVPLQYPDSFGLSLIFNLTLAIEIVPYCIALLFTICFTILALSSSADKTTLVWLVFGSL